MIENLIISKIIDLYSNKKLSLRKISEETGESVHIVTNILQNAGVYKFIDSNILPKESRTFVPELNKKYVARCLLTNKEFDDFLNKSGQLTIHILKLNPNAKIPETGFKKRIIFKKTGKFWYEEFFEIDQVEIIENTQPVSTCKYCEWTTFDLDNKSGAYTLHLKEKHNKTIDEYVIDYPGEKILFKTHFNKKELKDFINSSPDNHTICKVCGEKLKKITNSHLKKHNLSLFEYKLNYSQDTLSVIAKDNCIRAYEENLKFFKNNFTSSGHKEIIEFLFDLGLSYEVNNKSLLKGIELDILIHDKKIAIEYNGLLYHSELFGKKLRNYHLNKTNKTNECGYSLIHIFEDDWILKKDIIKSKLKHLLGLNNSTTIHARKCIIKKITPSLKNVFLNNNHIQGEDLSEIYLGAYNNEEIVAVMTFDFNRYMSAAKKSIIGEYELKRFATKIDYRIPGIASKMLKYFVKNFNPTKIISFADKTTTINTDNLYTKIGFVYKETIGPDYKYFNTKISRNRRLHKFGFGKNSIKKKFPEVYDSNKTEWEMMQELGYDRIWDCGKHRYEMEIKIPDQQ